MEIFPRLDQGMEQTAVVADGQIKRPGTETIQRPADQYWLRIDPHAALPGLLSGAKLVRVQKPERQTSR